MSSENIIAIIKWGPILLFLVVFLLGMLYGLIKGRRKSLRRFIYVLIYLVLIFLFTPKICELVMNINIDGVSVSTLIDDFIANNESINKIFNDVPGLQVLVKTYPNAIVSLALFLVLVLVGLPLSFPIYWIYMGVYALISKVVFSYSRFKKDENGNYIRNEKGKKIKDKKDKHRLTGALIKGTQGVIVTSIVFMPIGVITRLYEDGKEASVNKDLSNIEYLKNYKEIMKYLDVFNNSLIGKATNSKLNESLTGYLTQVETNEGKIALEEELSNIVVAAVYLEESGLIKLLSNKIDINTLNLETLRIEKIEAAIEMLFNSSALNTIVSDGVNYVLSNYLNDTFVNLTNDNNIIEKIKYNNATEVKEELLRVTDVLKTIINAKLLNVYQNNEGNYVAMVNSVSSNDVETILNKVLSIKILSKSMPGIVKGLLDDYGLKSSLTESDSSDLVKVIVDVVDLAHSLEITRIEDISEGNVVDNLVNILYENGTIKENSKEALASLLSRINSSRVFSEVLVEQLNKLLEESSVTLNSQMIVNVKTVEDWNKELMVLDNIVNLYNGYNKDNTIDFLEASELLDNLKNTKAMILAFPLAYQKLFPSIGIEIDSSKIEYIDYDKEGANEAEANFYKYWKDELLHIENISDELAKLNIKSVSDVSLDLLEIDSNVTSLSVIMSEMFTSDLLKDGVVTFLNDNLSSLVAEYGISLNEDAITNVNNVVNTTPYYIVIDDIEYEVNLVDDKYYIEGIEVVLNGNSVNYNSREYVLIDNTLARVWKHDLTRMSNIVSVIKTGKYSEKENLSILLNSLDEMYLLKDVKNDLLLYAVKELNVLPSDEYDRVESNKENIVFSEEKEILLNVIDHYELLTNLNVDFANISDDEINDLATVLDNVLNSNIFGNYVATTIVDLANDDSVGVPLTLELVKDASSWESDLKLMKKALNMNTDAFNKESIEEILVGIKSSTLLGPIKEDILLDTIKKINITGVTLNTQLNSNEINYDLEMAAILTVANNLELIEDLAKEDFNLTNAINDNKTIDSLSNVLTDSLKSKIMADSVASNLVNVLENNGIKHDSGLSDNLKITINDVSDWKSELDVIKTLIDIDQKSELTSAVFASLEGSELLYPCRANLMIKMVESVGDSELIVPTVSDLTDNGYAKYIIEKELLLRVIELDDLDTSNITDDNKSIISSVLDDMKESIIFENKYNELIDTMAEEITKKENSISIVSDRSNIYWDGEIDTLLEIKDTVDDLDTISVTDANAASNIAKVLDLIDRSDLITDSSSENVAASIIRRWTNKDDVTITKTGTWEETFEAEIAKLKP